MTSKRKKYRKNLMSLGLNRNEANALIAAFYATFYPFADEKTHKTIEKCIQDCYPKNDRQFARCFLDYYRIYRKERRIQF